jgi:hypothetical protein
MTVVSKQIRNKHFFEFENGNINLSQFNLLQILKLHMAGTFSNEHTHIMIIHRI